jgi:hypothetical protein
MIYTKPFQFCIKFMYNTALPTSQQNLFRSFALPLREGRTGTAWEPSRLRYSFWPPKCSISYYHSVEEHCFKPLLQQAVWTQYTFVVSYNIFRLCMETLHVRPFLLPPVFVCCHSYFCESDAELLVQCHSEEDTLSRGSW